MLVQEINELKEILNKQVETCSLDNEIILEISRNLDQLIIDYYKYEIKTKE